MNICMMGSGTMGQGIVQVFAAAGNKVFLFGRSEPRVLERLEQLRAALDKQVARGKMTQEQEDYIFSNVFVGKESDKPEADFFLEAIVEELEAKRELFLSLDKICKPECVFLTNTSSLSISDIGRGLEHPMMGMHFFNPVPVMQLVEVIRGETTTPAAEKLVIDFIASIGKTPVSVNEAPGFVVNRVLIPMINEAVTVLSEGTASAEDIDTAMKLGANHPIGPLALSDLIGNDVVLHIMNILHKELKSDKYAPSPLLVQMVKENKLGRKTKIGFFTY